MLLLEAIATHHKTGGPHETGESDRRLVTLRTSPGPIWNPQSTEALLCREGGDHELRKRRATLVDRHPLTDHSASGVVLALMRNTRRRRRPRTSRGFLYQALRRCPARAGTNARLGDFLLRSLQAGPDGDTSD